MTTRLIEPARAAARGATAADAPHGDVRRAGAATLADALRASRADTLATFDATVAALGSGAAVPQAETLNPPLWELGHIGWFQERWIARNPQRRSGWRADPDAPQSAPLRAEADALYDSSRVAHATRWSLPLPDAAATKADLAAQLDRTLALLADTDHGTGAGADRAHDDALYFFRLVLLHEDMHHEAALMMAQSLGLPIADPRWQPRPLPDADSVLELAASTVETGSRGAGFAFDNELAPHPVELGATAIDARVVRWAEYLRFVDADGYADERWWRGDGAAWRAATRAEAPAGWRRGGGDAGWQQRRWGAWVDVDPALPACHLSAHEADAYCAWAGRRLPSEAEWERAAVAFPDRFAWGDVWEWTASTFAPYPGFVAHPYRDYSAPWFGDRRVLKGASFATQPRMRHPRFRNFYAPSRSDVFAGFRTCAA